MKVIDRIAGEILEGERMAVLEEAVDRVHDYTNAILTTGEEEDTLYIQNA